MAERLPRGDAEGRDDSFQMHGRTPVVFYNGEFEFDEGVNSIKKP